MAKALAFILYFSSVPFTVTVFQFEVTSSTPPHFTLVLLLHTIFSSPNFHHLLATLSLSLSYPHFLYICPSLRHRCALTPRLSSEPAAMRYAEPLPVRLVGRTESLAHPRQPAADAGRPKDQPS